MVNDEICEPDDTVQSIKINPEKNEKIIEYKDKEIECLKEELLKRQWKFRRIMKNI